MKKILLAVWCSLMVALTMNAQRSSGNEFIDGMLQEADEIASMYEQELAKQGLESQIQLYFDSEKNELVYSFRVFNQQLFNNADAEYGLSESIIGMVKSVMVEDESGNAIVAVGNQFKRTNTGMRIEYLYQDQKKSASATADKILEVIYKTFQ